VLHFTLPPCETLYEVWARKAPGSASVESVRWEDMLLTWAVLGQIQQVGRDVSTSACVSKTLGCGHYHVLVSTDNITRFAAINSLLLNTRRQQCAPDAMHCLSTCTCHASSLPGRAQHARYMQHGVHNTVRHVALRYTVTVFAACTVSTVSAQHTAFASETAA
jgi:hypothetical protein